MKLPSGSKNFDREPIQAGMQHAICRAVIDLGVQPAGTGQYAKEKHQMVVLWELEQCIQDQDSDFFEKHMVISKTYTASASEKSILFKDVKSWLNIEIQPGDDPEQMLVGAKCLLNLSEQKSKTDPQKTFTNIAAVCPPMQNAPEWPAEIGKDVAQWRFPKWIQGKRDSAVEKAEDYGCQWEPSPESGMPPVGSAPKYQQQTPAFTSEPGDKQKMDQSQQVNATPEPTYGQGPTVTEEDGGYPPF